METPSSANSLSSAGYRYTAGIYGWHVALSKGYYGDTLMTSLSNDLQRILYDQKYFSMNKKCTSVLFFLGVTNEGMANTCRNRMFWK